jgi:hypothetical protein
MGYFILVLFWVIFMMWVTGEFDKPKVDLPNYKSPPPPKPIEDLYSFSKNKWIKFEDEKPPHVVVLASIDTYDCGWTIDTAWWYEKKQCWMTTGGATSERAQLNYTHWQKLPLTPGGD